MGTSPDAIGPIGSNCDVTNLPPVAVATANPTSGIVPLTVQLDGSGSYVQHVGNTIGRYEWSWLNEFGGPTVGATPQITIETPGVYEISLVVTDNSFATDTATVTINAFGDGVDSDNDGIFDDRR